MPELLGSCRYELLRTADALIGIAPDWAALHDADPHATPFQRPEWLLPWWRQFGPDAGGDDALCVVTMRQGDRLLALLPFYRYTDGETSACKLMLLGVGTSDYLDGVYAPECTVQHVQSALVFLQKAVAADTLSLVQLRPGSLLAQAMRAEGRTSFLTDACSCLPAVSMASLPTKIRRNAMYYRNAAQRRGRLRLDLAEEANCLTRFDDLVRLHGERWQGRGESGVLADPKVLAWHREALPLLARAGTLRLYTLLLNDEPIAAMYALADRPGREQRAVYFYLPGISMQHGELRPGTLLMAFAIEHAAAEGICTVDLLRGNESYKQHWHAVPVETYGSTVPWGMPSIFKDERNASLMLEPCLAGAAG